jgi:hypothetical protein
MIHVLFQVTYEQVALLVFATSLSNHSVDLGPNKRLRSDFNREKWKMIVLKYRGPDAYNNTIYENDGTIKRKKKKKKIYRSISISFTFNLKNY